MSKRILLVEDVEDNRQLVRDLIARRGLRAHRGARRPIGGIEGGPVQAGPDLDGHSVAGDGRI